MKKRTKGFTLIELLAVIVILAIIAIIAVPVIMNIISKANKSAFKDTAYGVIQAGELYYAEQLLEPNGMTSDVTITLPDATKKLQIKGEVPDGSILITTEGKVAIAVHNNRYCVTKGLEDDKVTMTEDIANCTLPSNAGGVVEKTLSELKESVHCTSTGKQLGECLQIYDANDKKVIFGKSSSMMKTSMNIVPETNYGNLLFKPDFKVWKEIKDYTYGEYIHKQLENYNFMHTELNNE